MRAARSCFVLLALAGAAFVALTLPALPPRPATHFNLQGAADGWATRGAYVMFLALIGVGLPLMVVGLVPGLGATKPELLNVPGKDYWLPPARRAEGVRRVTAQMWWLACLMLGLTLAIHWLILAAHAASPPRLPTGPFLGAVAGFLLGLALWIRNLNATMRPPARGSTAPG